jgi:type IV pilus assembly protein PilC
MAKFRCFSPMVIQLVRVGEQTGTLEPVLNRAAGALERRRILWTQMLTAMAYPAVVCVAAIGVAGYMILGVIPKLQKLLVSLGRKLPAITQALLDVSDFFQVYLPAILGGMVGLILIVTTIYLTARGRLAIDRAALRLPLLGYLFRLSATTQFSYALGTLLRSGVTLVESLRTVAGLHSNRYAGSIVLAARDAVVRGGNLADQLMVPSVYMPMLPRMVAVGEAAGTLDDVLDEVARFHESQLQVAIRRLSVLIEPIIIIVVGGIVGFVYIAFFVALFSVAGGPR